MHRVGFVMGMFSSPFNFDPMSPLSRSAYLSVSVLFKELFFFNRDMLADLTLQHVPRISLFMEQVGYYVNWRA